MEAFKIKKHIESEVLNLPIPKELIGKEAEIIVLVESNDLPERISKPDRKPGSAKGMIWMSDDFEKPLDEEVSAEFYK